MKNLRISVYKPGHKEPDKIINMPLTSLHIALELLPQRIRSSLDNDGIDLTECRELTKVKELRGTLIEIEQPNERMVISVESVADEKRK
jgi:hypothetical protein